MALCFVAAQASPFDETFECGVLGAEAGGDALPHALRSGSEADEVGFGGRYVEEVDRRARQQCQGPVQEPCLVGTQLEGDQGSIHAARNEGAPGGIAAGDGRQALVVGVSMVPRAEIARIPPLLRRLLGQDPDAQA